MKKLKLKELEIGAKEVLTREQLKNVLGGAGSGGGRCSSAKCSVVDGSGIQHDGTCGQYTEWDIITPSPIYSVCECITSLGMYTPSSNGGVSRCYTPN